MDEFERLRIEVQDERARRRWAERELLSERERRALWRQRAEDRTLRIELLEERLRSRSERTSLLGRLRRSLSRTAGSGSRVAQPGGGAQAGSRQPPRVPSPHSTVPAPSRAPRAYPTVKVAAIGSDLPGFLSEFELVEVQTGGEALYDSDFVFASTSGLSSLDPEASGSLRDWLGAPGRQKFVVWTDTEARAESDFMQMVAAADLVIDPADAAPSDAAIGVTMDGVPVDRERAFELMADAVPIVTNEMAGEIADQLGIADRAPVEIVESIDETMALRLSVVGRRLARRTAAPSGKAADLLQSLGIGAPAASMQVAALLSSNKPELVVSAAEMVLAQRNVDVFPVVVLHGDPTQFATVQDDLASRLGDLPHRMIEVGADVTLGEALNIAAAASPSPFLAKIDDDDWYGPSYLEDAVAAMVHSRAEVVGKARYFVSFDDDQDVYLVDGPEETFTSHVIGSSIVVRRRLWEDVPFPHRPSRVDSIFLRAVRAEQRPIYSTSRFDFAVKRRSSGHTWEVDPAHFAARGIRVGSSLAEVGAEAPDSLLRGL